MEAALKEIEIERLKSNSAHWVIGPRREKVITRLTRKYGPEIIHDFNRLISNPYWTLHLIATKYHVTREAIRQLILKVYGKPYSEFLRQKSLVRKEARSCSLHPLAKEFNRQHGDSEAKAYRFLMGLGYAVKPSTKKTCDMIVNGYQVDVKSCIKRYNGNRLKSTYYSWGITKSQIKAADFFIVHVIPEDRWFVVPNVKKHLPLNGAKAYRGYIRMNEILTGRYCKPNSLTTPSLHENNWLILKRPNL